MIIEAIIARFQDAGFVVRVIPGVLLVRKSIGKEELGVAWAITKEELASCPIELLFDHADRYIEQLNQAIAEKKRDSTKEG